MKQLINTSKNIPILEKLHIQLPTLIKTAPIIKILIVEDQAEIRHLIKIALNLNQYEIHEASDAQMGLKMVQAIRPDLVLLDIMMPIRLEVTQPSIVNGLDLCRMLKSNVDYADIAIILLTANGQLSDKQAGLAAGADDYIVKPFSIANLIEAVQRHTNKLKDSLNTPLNVLS